MQIKDTAGTTVFRTVMTYQGLVSAVMKTVNKIQKHVVKNVICIYVSQKLLIALNIFILNSCRY